MSNTTTKVPEQKERQVLGEELPELAMVHPMPGFPSLKRFVLVRLAEAAKAAAEAAAAEEAAAAAAVAAGGTFEPPQEDDGAPLLFELRSLEKPDVRFLVGSPAAFFPEYEVDLDEQATDELNIQDAGDALILVILSMGQDLQETTANLMAPLVINAKTRLAAQVILNGSNWPVRAAVV